ncbi:MAG: hypothetical protein HOW73_13375 [Polyangiaceae bacterium]|nr:hypothetical protein [Polyangiaceae bacterium]
MHRRFFSSGITFVVVSSLFAPAHAQQSPAEKLFQEGRDLVQSGRVEEACPKFQESLALEFAMGTLLNLAECEAIAGRTATAWARFGELEKKARFAGQADREEYARKRIEELAPQLTYVELRLPKGVPVERLEIDEKELSAATYGHPLPLDPGEHAVVVTSEGSTYRTTFEVPKAGGRLSVDIELGDAHRLSSGDKSQPSGDGASGVDPRHVAGWIGVALGVVGLGVGTYMGARASMLSDVVDASCDDRFCDADGLEAFDQGKTLANGATIAFAISGPVLAAGTGVLIWATVEPRTSASIQVAGRF